MNDTMQEAVSLTNSQEIDLALQYEITMRSIVTVQLQMKYEHLECK